MCWRTWGVNPLSYSFWTEFARGFNILIGDWAKLRGLNILIRHRSQMAFGGGGVRIDWSARSNENNLPVSTPLKKIRSWSKDWLRGRMVYQKGMLKKITWCSEEEHFWNRLKGGKNGIVLFRNERNDGHKEGIPIESRSGWEFCRSQGSSFSGPHCGEKSSLLHRAQGSRPSHFPVYLPPLRETTC